ncbi:hypothetical protein WR25_17069 isoform B [Diploscapter pachys]|uniref:CARD domain-containing protein n=1 Tax=Diploscapter pachys TaxID=2018661 RepID=A0A2A2L3U8_9BILA|nr:hypothetical protein WR25_17069 isoform B [Diploscapter pachys]
MDYMREDRRESEAIRLESLRPLLQGIDLRDLAPVLVARNIIKSYEMNKLYAEVDCLAKLLNNRRKLQSTADAQINAFIELLKTKYDWTGALTDALIRNGKCNIAQKLMEMQSPKSARA